MFVAVSRDLKHRSKCDPNCRALLDHHRGWPESGSVGRRSNLLLDDQRYGAPVGSITAYATAAEKRYRVRYRKPAHSQTDKRGFQTKRDAELFLAYSEVRKATGEFIDATASRISTDELGVAWLAAQSHLKPSSYSILEIAWRVHVRPACCR